MIHSKLLKPTLMVTRLRRHDIPSIVSLVTRSQSTDFYKKAMEEGGHLQWERAVSTDKRYEPPPALAHNTFWRFLSWTMREKYELWPLVGFLLAWAVGFGFVATHSLNKHEIQIDRSKALPPWDWEREKDQYYKVPCQIYYPGHNFETKQSRLRILETLENKMLEAAKKKGTR